MSSLMPGQIRCPTCQRSTPPGAFCTQCGTPIPASARARPRGLDREELEERIRAYRPGDAPFRRGSPVGGEPDEVPSSYRPFQPEPEDELVLPGAEPAVSGPAHVDNTPAGFDAAPPPVPPAPPAAEPSAPVPSAEPSAPASKPSWGVAPRTPRPVPWRPAPREPQAPTPAAPADLPAPRWVPPDEPYPVPAYSEQPYPEPSYPEPSYRESAAREDRYRRTGDDWGRRSSGVSPMAVGGFILLGILAIAMGALISGVFSGGAAVATPSPTPFVTPLPTATAPVSLAPSVAPSVGGSLPASLSPGGSPVPFPDNFTARTEPCAEEPSSADGCGSSGATVSGSTMWAWVGFRKGNSADVLGITIVNASGSDVGDGSLALSSIGCGDSCSGWARFKFNGLAPGSYTIRVDRNGEPAAEATFTVTG
jgi:hypothetical protein